MTTSIEPVLRSITATIVHTCDPDEVVLFGSWAKGTAGVSSDLDVLIIGEFVASRWLRDRDLKVALREYPITIDLHLYTREEVEIETRTPHSWLETLRLTSRTLYRRGEIAELEQVR